MTYRWFLAFQLSKHGFAVYWLGVCTYLPTHATVHYLPPVPYLLLLVDDPSIVPWPIAYGPGRAEAARTNI